MRKENCFGYHNGNCTATTYESCDRCPFFATRLEAEQGRAYARMSLVKRGLEPCIEYTEEGPIMSTRKVK